MITVFHIMMLLLSAAAAIKVGDIGERETAHEDPLAAYPYHLMSTSAFGRISDDVHPGSRVPVDTSLTHLQHFVGEFLELKVNRNGRVSQCYNITGYNRTRPYDVKGPESLIGGLKIDFSDDQGNMASVDEDLAFAVDEDNYVVVGNPHSFSEVDEIEFWVVAICHIPGSLDRVESNPLPFIVTIDHQETTREGAALYAGVIVLVVCFFVILIPLTVRTKRRMREGKPVCACGSSAKRLEENNQRKAIMNGNGINGGVPVTEDTLSVIYEGHSRAETEAPQNETFQSKNLRSASEHHFQPRWLDPHYKSVYVHPHYKRPQPVMPPAPTPFSTSLSRQGSVDPAAPTAAAAKKRAPVHSAPAGPAAPAAPAAPATAAANAEFSGAGGAIDVKM